MREKTIEEDRELEKGELLQMLFIISFSILALFIACLLQRYSLWNLDIVPGSSTENLAKHIA